nr:MULTISPECIES: CGNR zinc finger domain-containing protein [unclassified Frigoribacterium]
MPADGSTPWDGLLLPADLDDWIGERFDGIAGSAGDRELADARGLRDAVARLAVAAADGTSTDPDDVDTLNLFAALPDVPPSLEGGRRQAGAGRLRLGQAMASVARDAVTLFTAVGFVGGPDSRLRRCTNEACGLVFFDESRAGSRRWCSMQRCGNRAKVRAHRARAARA